MLKIVKRQLFLGHPIQRHFKQFFYEYKKTTKYSHYDILTKRKKKRAGQARHYPYVDRKGEKRFCEKKVVCINVVTEFGRRVKNEKIKKSILSRLTAIRLLFIKD